MLVKLRISNEQEWIIGEYDSNITYEQQYRDLYTELTYSLGNDNIPTSISSGMSSTHFCLFTFNGFDKKTNTYFFEFINTYIV
jgi:hypothetical protein